MAASTAIRQNNPKRSALVGPGLALFVYIGITRIIKVRRIIDQPDSYITIWHAGFKYINIPVIYTYGTKKTDIFTDF